MPIGSKRICTYPGCNTLVFEHRCAKHPYHREDTRPSAIERGYDSKWTRLRNAYVRAHPICEIQEKCNGDAVAEVDHIVPIAQGGARLDERNLQGACRPCHAWKTKHIDAQGAARRHP